MTPATITADEVERLIEQLDEWERNIPTMDGSHILVKKTASALRFLKPLVEKEERLIMTPEHTAPTRVWVDSERIKFWDNPNSMICAAGPEISPSKVDVEYVRADLHAELENKIAALSGPEADMRDYHEGVVGSLSAENARLRERLAEAERVIEPFAEVAEDFDRDGRDLKDTDGIYANVAGDFRAARTWKEQNDAD